jgi:WD40 domain-containing protein
VSERSVKRFLASTPADEEAEERAWAVVRAAYAEHEPARRRPPVKLLLTIAAGLAVAAAATLSPPGRAVVNAVRRSIGIEHAAPALFRLPAQGRLLVAGGSGAWVIAADGSMRRLGDYPQASWSPHALYVVAAAANQLATLEPTGKIHWTLSRPQILFPRWGGTHTDTRIAYLTAGRLHVVAGDDTGDHPAGSAAAWIAPAWRPSVGDRHLLAYVTAGGRVVLLDTDRGTVEWRSAAYVASRALAWSPDGARLALATRAQLVLFNGATGRVTVVPVEGVRALAFARDGRLALLRGHSVLLVSGSTVRTLFVAPGGIAGLAWSPDGRWLLTGLPAADQWIFLQTHAGHRVLAVSHISAQFGAFPTLSGWAP